MSVVAKFVAETVIQHDTFTQVSLSPVYHGDDPDHPNRKFWEATPSGRLDMSITNPAAAAYFEEGGVYLLTFEREQLPASLLAKLPGSASGDDSSTSDAGSTEA